MCEAQSRLPLQCTYRMYSEGGVETEPRTYGVNFFYISLLNFAVDGATGLLPCGHEKVKTTFFNVFMHEIYK